mmetsp:Transcript_48215/g.140483  ORF Transcript_48215/g.140483 Transcript_48215/m.140483 type:complete len:248 (+) Transcript_48215:10-753(+)
MALKPRTICAHNLPPSSPAGPEAEARALLGLCLRLRPPSLAKGRRTNLRAPHGLEKLLGAQHLSGQHEEAPAPILILRQLPQRGQLAVRDATNEDNERDQGPPAGGGHLLQLLRRAIQQGQGVLPRSPTLRAAPRHLHEPYAERRITAISVTDVVRLRVVGKQLELPLDACPDGLRLEVPQHASALHVAQGEQVLVAVCLQDAALDLVQLLRLDPVAHERMQAEQPHHLVKGLLVVDPVLDALKRRL